MKQFSAVISILCSLLTVNCARSTGHGAVGAERSQLLLVSSGEIAQASAQAYEKTMADARLRGDLDVDLGEVARVTEISRRLVPVTKTFRADAPDWDWDVHVIRSKDLNAYCMPGGKIAFYSALIEQLRLTDAEIATVMGHEIAHALREHGRERVSAALLEQSGLALLTGTGLLNPQLAPLLQNFAELIINLPHGRTQESEADIIGLELMARGGYDPRAAVSLWRKMSRAGGKEPPEILSTHPADETRIHNIEAHLEKVLPLYLEYNPKPQ